MPLCAQLAEFIRAEDPFDHLIGGEKKIYEDAMQVKTAEQLTL